MLVRNNLFVLCFVIFTSQLVIPTTSLGDDDDLLELHRDLQLLELKSKKAKLQSDIRKEYNKLPGKETSLRRDVEALKLRLEREELIHALARMKPTAIPPGAMFVWEVSGMDGELKATIIRLNDPKDASKELSQTNLDTFHVMEGDTIPGGWTVVKLMVDGAELSRKGKTRRVGLLMSDHRML